MTGIQKLYFVCAWIVTGLAVLATILLGIANGGVFGFGVSVECIFLGVTACITLLYLSGFFTSQTGIFIIGIGVGCLALISLLLHIFGSRVCVNIGWGPVCAWAPATQIAGSIFLVLFLGIFCTILLIRLSGKFGD